MADVLLHDYVEQMRGHVRAGHFSDASALGKHILHYYPKHVETYVILAQASLENDDLGGAADLFRRVLSADPENVVALAGMALISEAQDKNDEALWYLERAHEIQPTNDELRTELMRIREIYYGTAPERLEMTPGALARIYARQGLYSAAINEFRRLLRTESQRYDARVALAETLYRAGRTDEAAQLAQNIMTDAPYALKPNLILGVLWTENAVAEGQQFLARAQALDPESRVARELVGPAWGHTQSPLLPSLEEQIKPSELDSLVIGTAFSKAPMVEQPAAASADWEELPGAEHEPATPAVVATAADISAFEQEPETQTAPALERETKLSPPVIALGAAALTGIVRAAETEPAPAADATLSEIAAAEQQVQAQAQVAKQETVEQAPTVQDSTGQAAPKIEPPIPVETAAPRARPKDGIPTDAIAAAAAALATSIAVDKLRQPAPARRTHPALPKVRPVIRGAAEKLPAWLYLSAPPAQAAALFDTAPQTEAERIEPMPAALADDRPTWLKDAQVASLATAAAAPIGDPDIPDWLRAAQDVDAAQETAQAAPQEKSKELPPAAVAAAAAAVTLPEWLREPETSTANKTESAAPAPTEQSSIAALPEWLQAEQSTTTTAEPTNAPTSEGWTNEPAEKTAPVYVAAIENEPVPVRAETSPTKAAMPKTETAAEKTEPISTAATGPLPEKPLDARALIENARQRRDNGDLKGALDLYERAMHRRPNHLDEIIVDLQDLEKNPNAPITLHRLLGEAFAMAGRYKESLEQYRLAMAK